MFIVNIYMAVFFLIEVTISYNWCQYLRIDVFGISSWRSLATADIHANRKLEANIMLIFVTIITY